MNGPPLRILFGSCHGLIDPSSGAAVSALHLLEMMAQLGHRCRGLSAGVLDYHREMPLEPILAGLRPRPRRASAVANGPVIAARVNGVPVTLLATASSRIEASPDTSESAALLKLFDRVLERFQPHVLLTYGGHATNRELVHRANRRGVAVVFFLRNLAYEAASDFAGTAGVLVPSQFARQHYAGLIGLEARAIPDPILPDRVVAADPQPRFLTFVNPIPDKGLAPFTRIAAELARRRPEIPILVVEGRGAVARSTDPGLDFAALPNVTVRPSTPDPREFYRISRAILVPSVVRETFGRVAAEAMANGLPVLASDRGALPETLAGSGFTLPLPTLDRDDEPGGSGLAPWLAVIERLWDDPTFEAQQRAIARTASRRYELVRIAAEYDQYFRQFARP